MMGWWPALYSPVKFWKDLILDLKLKIKICTTSGLLEYEDSCKNKWKRLVNDENSYHIVSVPKDSKWPFNWCATVVVCMGCGIVVHCIYAYSSFVHNCPNKRLALVLGIWSYFFAAGIWSPWCFKMSAWQTGASLDVRSSAANSLYHRDCCRISEGRV